MYRMEKTLAIYTSNEEMISKIKLLLKKKIQQNMQRDLFRHFTKDASYLKS